ncbi:tetratricopeptide repeat protein [Alphaproteobacteria bacterium]|nr:tetratricopeptide repeat protein [Alphaproteobacteria bacterium]
MEISDLKLKEKTTDLINLYNQRKFDEVADLTKKLIKQYPHSVILWNLLGAASKSLGNVDESISSFQKVIDLNPRFADGYNNLGVSLQEKGSLNESIKHLNKAISLRPKYAQAYNNIGIAYQKKGELNVAAKQIKKAISLNPNYVEAYNNLATIIQDQGNINQAIQYFNKAIFLNPSYPEAHYNLGLAFSELNEFDSAIQSYKKALTLKPNYPEAYNGLATIISQQGKTDEAIKLFNKALLLKPDYSEVYYNIGIIFKKKNRLNEALESYHKAINYKPNDVASLYNIAIIYHEQGKLNEAIDYCDKALLKRPDYDKAQAQKLYQKAQTCDWETIQKDKELFSKLGTLKNHIPPFTMLFFEDNPTNHYLRSKLYAKKKYLQKQIPFDKIHRISKKERLRIGYFSADLQNHATMYLASKIFENYNKEKFEVYVYSFGESLQNDEVREKLKNSVDVFKDVINLGDKDIAMLARADQIDIAIDLKGYTKNSRTGIFAYRAAPIQINFLGYPGTMGAKFFDYIIADSTIIPESKQNFYSEKIIYMPHTYQPTSHSSIISNKIFTRSEMNLPNHSFVFCCFNNSYKISPDEFSIWMRILNKVENSVLWLISSNKWAKQNLRKEAENHGIASNRLIFAKQIPHSDHLARLKLADLFLDTFNVNAHTTTSDALWAGTPVITKLGNSFASRVAASILKAVELPELVVQNEKQYESLILEIANSPKKLFKIKQTLSANKLSKPLFNSDMYINHLEDAYRQVFENYLKGSKFKTIYIKP